MAEIIALGFIFVVIVTLIGYFFCNGSIDMIKVIGILGITIGVGVGVAFMFWLSITLFVLAWNLSVAAYFGWAALTFWKGFGFIWVGGILCKGESIVQSLFNLKKNK